MSHRKQVSELPSPGLAVTAPAKRSPFRILLKRLLITVWIVLIIGWYSGCTWENIGKHILSHNHHLATAKPCPQSNSLVPKKNAGVWSALSAIYKTEEFKDRAVNWLGGAVRVPTESYDNMEPVGTDPRWEAFGPFHDYLLEAFPLVHTTLLLRKINTYGLLYEWTGSDTALKPLLLAGHQDVVPVEPTTVDDWDHPPYSGHFDGTSVWGRGSSDDKSGLIGILSAVESLLEKGFKPTRTVVLAFGFDEEASGYQGAGHLGLALLDTYGSGSFALIVDEGVGFSHQYGSVFAAPGVAEKGYVDVRVEVATQGGHSSIPPKHTSIGILSRLLVQYEKKPQDVYLGRDDPLYATLQCVAQYALDLPSSLRKTIKRSAYNDKALDALQPFILDNPTYRSLVGTTQAIDLIHGGVKSNALPEQAWAIVNHRVSISSSIEKTQDYDTQLLKPLAEKFNLTFNAFGSQISPKSFASAGSLTLSDAFHTGLEPAPLTPTDKDAAPYQLLSGTIKATYNSHRDLMEDEDAIIITPGMMSGNTDTRHYWTLSHHIFRYSHHDVGTSANGLSNVHTVNEYMEIDGFVEMIRFFTTLVLNVDESTTL